MDDKVVPLPIAPVRKVVTFAGPPAAAFAWFTEGIGTWWPTATHSLGAERVASVGFDGRGVGARLVERWHSGEVEVWGTVTRWEPPDVLAFTWHVGRQVDTAQIIEVRFVGLSDQSTEVELIHSGWEHLGETGAKTRDSYEQGWDPVLARFIDLAALP